MLEGLDRAHCADGSECNNIVEALCYVVVKGKWIVSRYVRSRINNNVIAGCLGLIGLRQQHTKFV